MAKRGRSAAYLKSLRKKYRLGEFAGRRRITKRYEPDKHKRKVLRYYQSLGIKDLGE